MAYPHVEESDGLLVEDSQSNPTWSQTSEKIHQETLKSSFARRHLLIVLLVCSCLANVCCGILLIARGSFPHASVGLFTNDGTVPIGEPVIGRPFPDDRLLTNGQFL